MAESDRRLEVLYDAGTFTLHDPEYDITKQASSPGEAYQSAEEILAADPSMDLTRMQRKGFDKGWLRRFEELSSQQSNTTTLQFNLADWVIE